MPTVKQLIPAPIRSLKWRMHWMSGTEVYRQAPFMTAARLLRWTALELMQRDAEFATADGAIVRSMAKNFSSLSVYLTGERDPELQTFIRRRLRPGDVFLDVGANVGIYTVFAGKLVGPSGRVVAIEANPSTFAYLADNIVRNRLENVTPLNCAAGEEQGALQIAENARNAGETHIATAAESGAAVPVDRLDVILRRQGIDRIDYFKIDIEGFELPALRGAADTLRHSPDVVVQTELVDAHARRYGYSIRQIVEFMSALGLSPHVPDRAGTATPIAIGEIDRHSDVLWMRPAPCPTRETMLRSN